MNVPQVGPATVVPAIHHAMATPPPPVVLPAAPTPPAFALGPGHSNTILKFDNPVTGAAATKLYNKAIPPLDDKFNGEVGNLVVFLSSMCDRSTRFNWSSLIMVPIDDGTIITENDV